LYSGGNRHRAREVVVRVSLRFEVAHTAGEIAEPVSWPVYFAVDDAAARFLAGDVAATDWLVAPGPLAKGEAAAWQRDVAASGLAGGSYVGFGLLYSEGGASHDATRKAYQELVSTLQSLALAHVAEATGLGALLGGFGAVFDGKVRGVDLDKLGRGLDPEELAPELDPGLLGNLEGFREVAEALAPFTPGLAVAVPSSATRGTPVRRLGGNLTATPVVTRPPGIVTRPGVTPVTPVTGGVTRPGAKPTPVVTAVPRAAGLTEGLVRARAAAAARIRALENGTVVAVTVQAFRLDEVAAKGTLEFARELPVRGGLKVSLKLTGSVSGER
jgi:hypothetical protein